MKKTIGFTLVLMLLGSTMFGQMDRLMPHFGFMYEMVSVKRTDAPSTDRPVLFPYYGLNLGANYVLLHSNDQVSLGVEPNVNFAIFPTGTGGLGLLAQTPVFLMAKVGANCTPFNQQKIGIGAGIGVNYTYARYDGPDINTSYVAPAAIGEISLNLRSAVYILRGHFNLYPVQQNIGLEEYDFGNFGFGLVYGF